MLGTIQVDYAIFFSIIVVICSYIGNKLLDYIVKHTGKVSVMAVFLAIVMVLCTVIVFITTGIKISEKVSAGISLLQFKRYCP